MTRASVFFSLFLSAIVPPLLFAAPSVMTPVADLGVASPAAAGIPQIVRVNLDSNEPADLTMTLRLDDPTVASSRSTSDLLVRRRGEEWRPLVDGIPMLFVANDDANRQQMIVFELKATPLWSSAPALKEGTLLFSLNGIPLGETRIQWKIDSALVLTADTRPFDSPQIDPTRPGEYLYPSRLYRVRANVPWRLYGSVQAQLMREGAAESLRDKVLAVRGIDGVHHPFVPDGEPVLIAAGEPTGEKETPVEILLSIRMLGAEPGGAYEGALQFALAPVIQPE